MKTIVKYVRPYVMIVVGALLASFSVACILLPNDAIDYGTAGIGIIISKLTNWPLSICIFAVFLPFLAAGAFALGRSFLIRAAVGAVVYMAGIQFFENVAFELNTEHFIAAVFGGAILGVGLSMILRAGGCIDGSEIFATILERKASERFGRNFGLSGILLAFNACVYIAAFFLIDRNGALLSLLVYFIATTVIDNLTDRFEAVKQVTIITQKPDEIVKRIRQEMNKTCTIMDSYGAIAGQNKTLICYVTYFELFELKEIIRNYRDSAFIAVTSIDELIR